MAPSISKGSQLKTKANETLLHSTPNSLPKKAHWTVPCGRAGYQPWLQLPHNSFSRGPTWATTQSVPLTDDRVDVLGGVPAKSTDAGRFGRHGEAGQTPLGIHVLTDHGANFSHPCQPVKEGEGREGQNGTGSNALLPKRVDRGTYAERRFRRVSFRAKMWTVPLSLEAQRNEESWLKLMLWAEEEGDVAPQAFLVHDPTLCSHRGRAL